MNQQQAIARAVNLAHKFHATRFVIENDGEYRDVDENTLEACFPASEPVYVAEPE